MLLRGGERDYKTLALVALSTVGVTELLKNIIQKGGRRIWTLATIFVGVGMTFVALFLPEKVLYCIISVSGATVFYDTIYKSFKKFFENLSSKEKDKE